MISLVTVNYNNYGGLKRTLQSISEQEFGFPLQHIIIDGGSTDGSKKLLGDYKSKNTHVIAISEKDNGIYHAMNKGLQMANLRFVGFLNSGDVLASKDILNDLMEVALRNPDAGLIYGNLNLIDQHGHVKRVWRSKNFKKWKLLYGWCPPHPMTLISRSILENMTGFDERLNIAADYDLILSVLLLKDVNVCHIDKTTVNMEIGGVSNSSISQHFKSSVQVVYSWYKRVGWLLPIWVFFTRPLMKIGQLTRKNKN